MKTIWTYRDIDAPAEALWELITDLEQWPVWGPTVQSAELRGDQLELGATGTVTTLGGLQLGFEITAHDPGERWAWKVAGVSATDHIVKPLGADRCRVGMGIAWPAAPYLTICQLALRRLDAIALRERSNI